MTDSLWGEIPVAAALSTPNSVLIKQGEILTKATSGDLTGLAIKKTFESTFVIEFFIIVPALNNYRYHLLKVSHDVHLYPVRVHHDGVVRDCDDEAEFREALRAVLSSSRTKHVVEALLAQVRDDGEDIPS